MSTLAFYAQFVKSLVGVNSLTVTWDIEQITRSDGTRAALVTGGATSITIGRRGLYGYLLASADTKLYDYVATAITAGDVDQKEIAALWTMYEADGLKLAGQTVIAAAGVTFPASIASPTNITAGTINSVVGTVDANLVSILGTAITETAGLIAAAFSKFFNKATPTGSVNSLPDAVAGATNGLAIVGSEMDLVDAPNAMAIDAIQAGLSLLGSGAITFTYTLESSVDALPIADADVWVTTDSAGNNVIAVGRTNAAGQVVFYLDAGTVYVWRQKTGWTFTNPDTEVVA